MATNESARSPSGWSSEAREFVRGRQERAYLALADAMKLSSAAEVYARLSPPTPPIDANVSEAYQRKLGVVAPFSPEEWKQFHARVADLSGRYFSPEPPTRYESRSFYPVMSMMFDQLRDECVKRDRPIEPWPLLATLPTGNVNAEILREPETHALIMFFEQGLFRFFHDFALLVGWASPPLSLEQLNDDAALASLPRSYTMPLQASEFFSGALTAYVIDGTPIANPSPLPTPGYNSWLCMTLLNHMELFVMAHELGHIQMGHLSQRPAIEQEYEADRYALALVSDLAMESPGSWAVSFFAAELALTAFHFLYRAIAIVGFGPKKLQWISQTHPDPLSRRIRLRNTVSEIVPNVHPAGMAAASELLGMADALFQRLWDFASVALIFANRGGARPSPLWDNLVRSDIRVCD